MAPSIRKTALKLGTYGAMMRSWAKIATGQSYYHKPQGVGAAFEPGKLRGYFNDLQHKADWPGDRDADGLPLLKDLQGERYLFPTTVFQMGLGHWDRWLLGGEQRPSEDLAMALRIADWALQIQDASGCFPWPEPFRHGRMTTDGSAMSQGEGASLLVRAHQATGEQRYLQGAHAAVGQMLVDLRDGGCSARVRGGLRLEEYPSTPPSSVLNGWIFAIAGLYDVQLVDPRPEWQVALEDTAIELCRVLPAYDTGYWSRYDLAGMIASPFYHGVHIAQLQALSQMLPRHAAAIRPILDRFVVYQANPRCRMQALGAKVGQKLVDPPRALA